MTLFKIRALDCFFFFFFFLMFIDSRKVITHMAITFNLYLNKQIYALSCLKKQMYNFFFEKKSYTRNIRREEILKEENYFERKRFFQFAL